MAIPVVATKPGFYPNTMRAVGDRFTIASEKDFSENWMQREKPALRVGKGAVQAHQSSKDSGQSHHSKEG